MLFFFNDSGLEFEGLNIKMRENYIKKIFWKNYFNF